jgi:lipid A 3-O-deacylase
MRDDRKGDRFVRPAVLGFGRHGLILCALLWVAGAPALAQENSEKYVPDRYGLGLTIGHTVDPVGDIDFLMVTGSALFDYGKVWRHPAPRDLRFKLEASLGGSFRPSCDLMAAAGMLALFYLEPVSTQGFKPYIEGGIGLIFTEHRVEDQGLHFNFNPQIGFGSEFSFEDGATYFASLRWHHISNGGLDHENRGVNSIVLVIGRFFW